MKEGEIKSRADLTGISTRETWNIQPLEGVVF